MPSHAVLGASGTGLLFRLAEAGTLCRSQTAHEYSFRADASAEWTALAVLRCAGEAPQVRDLTALEGAADSTAEP